MRRIVITGLGIVSPIGANKKEFFRNASDGVSGIGKLSLFDTSTFDVKIGGEVKKLDLDALKRSYPGIGRVRDRKALLGLQAVEEALGDSGLDVGMISKLGIHLGIGLEVFHSEDLITCKGIKISQICRTWLDSGKSIHIQSPLDTTANMIINRYDCHGPIYINCSACAASAQAIGHSFRLIRSGRANLMLAGGLDSMLNPLGVGGFSMLGALTLKNELGSKACRPFDISRDGTVLGEGAAMFVIEELGSAKSREAKIYAEVAGFGSTLDAYKVSDPEPEGEGAFWAIKNAIKDAGITPDEINYINAHGTGTPKNDITETRAIKRLFGKQAYKIPVSATKSMVGHLIAASGAVELAASIIPLKTGLIPPTINLERSDPECDLDYVPDKHREFKGDYVLSNSFGFGGQNACIILKRYL
jgi:3-oxoacyl-[acyl-carrier-protein] synthase II